MQRWLVSLSFVVTGSAALAADIVSVLPLTDQILMVHVNEGKVIHHTVGQKRGDEKVVIDPLDIAKATRASTFSLRWQGNALGAEPKWVARKSKGTDFAWFVDKFENGVAVNDRPDHTKEHWLYLSLPTPMKTGTKYELNTGDLAKNGKAWTFTYDPSRLRSEAVHVNLIGYSTLSPARIAYVFHWMGDRGGLDLKSYEGAKCWVIENESGKVVHTGALKFRKPRTQAETANTSDSPPNGNFLGADVFEFDFSAFNKPGKYRVAVDGIGCSFPFEIAEDIYRKPFQITARGLYHNRSGIALTKPYTEYERPAPHNPKLTPGFAGKLKYTSVRMQDWGSEGGDPVKLRTGFKGDLEVSGWYQDAGDWDSYHTHLRVATELLFAFELSPKNFRDNDLNIPESGNGIPDIVDEAAWLPRFCYRLRQELLKKKFGTGGIGLRVAGDAFGSDGEGKPSWKDTDRIYAASGEDPLSTYRYAGTAAHLALAFKRIGKKDPEGIDWQKEAVEAYAWAKANTKPDDVKELKPHRAYASANLFRLTGSKMYEKALGDDTTEFGENGFAWFDDSYAVGAYCLGAEGVDQDSALLKRLKGCLLNTARDQAIRVPGERALRWGGLWWFPMLVGHQTTPWMMETAMAYGVVRKEQPELAKQFLAAMYATCDYMLGNNSLNMTWVTGLGPRYPTHVFHMDAWYNGKPEAHPGIIPYGIWRKEKEFGTGPWDQAWPHKTVYPALDNWPGNERWFSNRCAPMTGEFTVHQNSGPAAALFGILCAPRG